MRRYHRGVLFSVSHPPDPRPALLVQTTTRIDAAAIDELKGRMIGWGCPNGLLFDATECVILRDAYTSLEVDSLVEEGRVRTDQLLVRLPAGGRALEQRVSEWLRGTAASWNTTLPPDGRVAAQFIADIVPAVSGAEIREVA